jgi:hypothetical protein
LVDKQRKLEKCSGGRSSSTYGLCLSGEEEYATKRAQILPTSKNAAPAPANFCSFNQKRFVGCVTSQQTAALRAAQWTESRSHSRSWS